MAVAVVLLALLVLSNAVTLTLLARRRRADPAAPTDPVAGEAAGRTARAGGAPGGTRRIITVEVLNPIELAAARGRLVGVAGTLAPGLVTRVVHDRTARTLRRELTAQGVVAEVRLHTLIGTTLAEQARAVVVTDAMEQPDRD